MTVSASEVSLDGFDVSAMEFSLVAEGDSETPLPLAETVGCVFWACAL